MPTAMLPGRGTIAYHWTGEGPDTIVLLNGSVFNCHQWERTVLPILRRGLGGRCRFLQYDYIGVGGSSAKTKPFSFLDLADELRDLLDRLLVRRVHLLGVSKGSAVSQAFLIRHRERVKSFCGVGNPHVVSTSGSLAAANFGERLVALEDLKELWPQRVSRQNFARVFNHVYVPAFFLKKSAELSLAERLRVALVRQMIYPAMEGTFIQTMADLFRYYAGGVSHEEIATFAEGLPKISVLPVLLLNGSADTVTPVAMSRELAGLLPGAELVEYEGVTHLGPMMRKKDAQQVFGRYVEFMEKVLAG